MNGSKETGLTDIDEILKTISHAEATPEKLTSITDEGGFMHLSVELMKETASIVALAAGVLPPGSEKWNRDQAVVGGNFVRLAKLLSAHLDQVCQKRQETAFIFSRLLFENLVNIKFLIRNASPDLFDSYVRYALRHERKLRDVIHTNITAREGEKWHIENRMLSSIERYATRSGVKIDDITPNKPKDWGGKNFYEKTKDVGLESTYIALYGGSSRSIHGTWTDILDHHLEFSEDDFSPNFEWGRPRPQQILPIAQLILETTREFLLYVGSAPEALIIHRIDSIFANVKAIDSAHESWLSSLSDPEVNQQ
ncbi:hypothetical protein HYW58_02475 [Candidatus Kaiserbacteria bacterium]|nr:hypothetical protein [Candidatus Kaiserbacteria bacterium]